MIQSTRGLFLLAVLVAFVSLVMLFPARVAYRWAAPTAIAMSGIHGTVWRGKADALAAGGLVMQEVHWKFRPLRLLTGAMSYRVDGAFQSGFLQGHVALGIGGDLTVSELRATVPLAPFAQTLRVSGLKGEASARFGRVVIRRRISDRRQRRRGRQQFGGTQTEPRIDRRLPRRVLYAG